MARFLLRRLLNYVVLVIVATTLAYLLASVSLNPRSNFAGRNPPVPAASVNNLLSAAGINDQDPLLSRYGHWIGGVVQGNFGQTIDGHAINAQLRDRALVSLRLLLVGTVLGSVVGVLVGVWGAVRQYKPSDRVVTALAFFFIATPVFFTAVLLKFGALKVNGVAGHTLLPYTGYATPGLSGGFFAQAGDQIGHLVLPTLSIALGQIALFSRYQRSAMLDVIGSDFLRTAQAKGLTRRKALYTHGLRTALIPMATLIAYSIGTLAVGATFTETIFSWHGMGEWLVQSIQKNDINVVATVSFFTAVFICVSGFLSDVLYAVLDPRVRVQLVTLPTDPGLIADEIAATRPDAATSAGGDAVLSGAPHGEPSAPVSAGRGSAVWRRVLRNRSAVAGIAVIVALFVIAFIGPSVNQAINGWTYTNQDYNAFLKPPGLHHWFGTTQIGGDVFALTVRGLQKSLIIGLLVALISTSVSAVVGATAGYFGGWVDRVLMWGTDLLLVIPSFLITAILSPKVQQAGWLVLVVLIAAFSWMITARIVRGMTLSLREREFVLAARFSGVSSAGIIFRHLIPNMSSLLIIDATINVAAAVIAESGLSYFGFGIQPPDVSLGTLIASGTNSAFTYPWLFLFAGGLLVLTTLAVSVAGDGLRDALDPTSARNQAGR